MLPCKDLRCFSYIGEITIMAFVKITFMAFEKGGIKGFINSKQFTKTG